MTRDEEVRNAIDTIIPIFRSNNGRTYEQALMASGFEAGVKWADTHPKSPWISVDEDLPCNHEDMTAFTTAIGKCTYNVVVRFDYGGISLEYMYCSGYKRKWRWSEDNVTHWMRIPELPKE